MKILKIVNTTLVQSSILIVYGLIFVAFYFLTGLLHLDFVIIGLFSIAVSFLLLRKKLFALKYLWAGLMFFYFGAMALMAFSVLNFYGFTFSGTLLTLVFSLLSIMALVFSFSSLFSS